MVKLYKSKKIKYIRISVQIISLIFLIFFFVIGKIELFFFTTFFISLILAIFLGRIYCGWICPMNTLMIPVSWFSKKTKIQRKGAPKWMSFKFLPWIILCIFIAIMIIGRINDIQIPALLYLLILSVLFVLVFEPKIFHNFICPFGALQSLTGKFARLTERVYIDSCNGCRICEKTCYTYAGAVIVPANTKKATIDPKLCHQCFDCQVACPVNSIYYGKPK